MCKENSIAKAFKVANCIDNARWNNSNGAETLMNYAVAPQSINGEEIKAEYIILSHWLTYICERQMPYEQIWDNGSFVFSDMVRAYQKANDIDADFINRFVEVYTDDGTTKIRFKSETKPNDRVSVDNAGKEYAVFASRYVSVDMVAVFNTLITLIDARKNGKTHTGLYNYITSKLEPNSTMKDLLYCMYDLTYNGIGKRTVDELLSDEKDKIDANKIKLSGNKYDPNKYKKDGIFVSKRAICAIRDYFKNNEFNEHFKKMFKNENEFNKLLGELNQLELPGDVWNNNSKFGRCMAKIGFDYGNVKSKQYLNRALRTAYDDHNIKGGYPEQFDFTFDFVPRMCEKKKCNICVFKRMIDENNFDNTTWEKYCVNTDDKVCPILLQYCGYTIDCKVARKKGACLKEIF